MASDIPHLEVFVHNFLQVIDIILLIGQNKNTLRRKVKGRGLKAKGKRPKLKAEGSKVKPQLS